MWSLSAKVAADAAWNVAGECSATGDWGHSAQIRNRVAEVAACSVRGQMPDGVGHGPVPLGPARVGRSAKCTHSLISMALASVRFINTDSESLPAHHIPEHSVSVVGLKTASPPA